MPPAEGQQSATGAGTDARGQVNPGDSMDVDSTPALATSAAAAPPAATTSVPSTPAKDDALTTGGWGGAWNAWGPGTAVYDAGGQRYPSRTEGVASPAPANAAAKAILASRTRTEAPEESHEGSPAPSKGKGKQRATAVEAQKVPAPPKLRALQDDFRHDPPKSAVFLPDHHADSVFPVRRLRSLGYRASTDHPFVSATTVPRRARPGAVSFPVFRRRGSSSVRTAAAIARSVRLRRTPSLRPQKRRQPTSASRHPLLR
jgi:hypothetical protein